MCLHLLLARVRHTRKQAALAATAANSVKLQWTNAHCALHATSMLQRARKAASHSGPVAARTTDQHLALHATAASRVTTWPQRSSLTPGAARATHTKTDALFHPRRDAAFDRRASGHGPALVRDHPLRHACGAQRPRARVADSEAPRAAHQPRRAAFAETAAAWQSERSEEKPDDKIGTARLLTTGINGILKLHHARPAFLLLPFATTLPSMIYLALGVRGLPEDMIAEGGCLWFPDLSVPDASISLRLRRGRLC